MPTHPEVESAPVYKAPITEDREKWIEYRTDTKFGSATLTARLMPYRWEIGLIYVHGERRRGIASHVLRAFVKDIGPNRTVYGDITHDETIDVLRILGFEKIAIDVGKLIIKDERMLDLPVVRLLSHGGIDVHNVVIEYWKKRTKHGEPNHFYFSGVTQNITGGFEIIDKT